MENKFPITVFYHYYIPDSPTALFWDLWIDEQIGLAVKSGLSRIANFNMCITMPVHWVTAGNYKFSIDFKHKLIEYVKLRYPFVNILDVRDTGEPNIYEGSTLATLHKYCQSVQDEYIVYYHTKGSSNISPEAKLWRQLLDEIMINQWQMRYHDIQGYDAIGVEDSGPLNIFSGNYFWAKSNYIATLPCPLENFTDRYSFEAWLFLNNPQTKTVFSANHKDFYNDYVIYNDIKY